MPAPTAPSPARDEGAVLREKYDVLLLDLDGTVYQGPHAIPGAREALERGSQRLLYVTNNASRSPAEVADHLRALGFTPGDDDVVTSSQSAARLLAEHVQPGSAVLVVGTDALAAEVERVGLRPVRRFVENPAAVVQGHSPGTDWGILAEATLAIRAGALWIAANLDSTLPTERGLVLGNGSMVAAVRTATGREPLVAGKPSAPLMEDALRRAGASRPLVVGDRLDTDIAGANAVGIDSLLVLTGVSTAADLLRAAPDHRPTYVSESLEAVNRRAELSSVGPQSHWRVDSVDGDVVVSFIGDVGGPDPSDLPLAALLATLDVAWRLPEFGTVRGADDTARAVTSGWNARQ
ncbi:HAD-IIA family hydrolase [Rhodococcus sp. ABRD24]|uniref:HAD-IIA family hydrolase n=1 Tax=Rhodococcus sp. ABRD24 TaxID=2507582 RepID=UPI00103A3E20|nr:HAD-IIA family hydrolase [Rhodococcus sp. ABRD24]QBJ94699.1 HAD-IIA family hydrolase [Rhodococcus sp. ABRD24]